MTSQEKIDLLADTLDVEVASINEDTLLNDMEEWDSMSRLSIIVMMDDEFGKTISGTTVRNYKTIGDIMKDME